MNNIEAKQDNWTEVITPRPHVFYINFRELWEYRDLLLLFVKRDFASQYRQTVLGPLWHIVQPLLTMFMFLILFNRLAHIPTDGLPADVFYMGGIVIWSYFSACFTGTSTTFVSNASIFGKVYFPRLIMPLSVVTSNLIRFAIQFLLLLSVMAVSAIKGEYKFHVGWHTLLIPLVLFFMAVISLGTGIIISSLTTKYRDLSVLVSFGIQLLMYVVPVAYSLAYAEKKGYRTLIVLNPLSSLIETFRYAVLGKGTLDFGLLLYACICSVIILFIGILVFNQVEKSFMDTV
ncbi:ABC transporter permease [Foetidibacter luteolus]|uniref:ABC transporter permease n=1 Tax=Foetidibacter luteolus TaxID=2608880 RepID=UPI00129B0B93|nr:ABC transporter permease [Foetidibacter luteolus]